MITPSFSPTATERVLPKLALDFTTASLDSRITFTRALNTATRVNSSGNVEIVNADTPRFDYTFQTGGACKGLLIEEARTNSIRNNTATGAVAGSPGTMPTYWSTFDNGLTRTIVGTGTQNGVDYIDIQYSGTATGTSVTLSFESNSAVPASNGQAWSISTYIALVGGSFANVGAITTPLRMYSSGGSSLGDMSGTTTDLKSSIGSTLTRTSISGTANNASTAYVVTLVRFAVTAGLSYDFTIRVGLPQLELGAFSTSVIKTSSGTVTRNADVATMTGTNFSDWWVATNGSSDIWLIPKSTSTLAYMSFDDNTANNKIVIANSTTSGQSTITSGGVLQATLTAGTITANAINKVGCSWNTNNCAATANAITPATTASATIPSITQLRIGSNGSAYANAWVQKLFYWPQRITNNEIQAFTK